MHRASLTEISASNETMGKILRQSGQVSMIKGAPENCCAFRSTQIGAGALACLGSGGRSGLAMARMACNNDPGPLPF
jgi:hypothetical protein